MLPEEKLDKIKALFDSLCESDFSEILAKKILDPGALKRFNLDLFSKVIGTEKLGTVVSLTVKTIENNFIGNKHNLKNQIEQLLNSIAEPAISGIYHNATAGLLNSLSAAEDISFDRNLIHTNYRLILLNLFSGETNADTFSIITKEIMQELKKMEQNIDFEYLGLLISALKKKKAGDSQAALRFSEIDKELIAIIEKSFLEEAVPDSFQHLIDYPESSVLGAQFYLGKIFDEGKINDITLKLLLKFFANDLSLFYDYLSKRCQDIEMTEKILAILKTIDHNKLLDILEQIYLFSHNYIKLEILRIIGERGQYHKDFLMEVLSKEDAPLRKEALITLMKDEKIKQEILENLFSIKSPWRIDAVNLLSNIRMIEELNIRDARDYLVNLNKRIFFWNWEIKKKINNTLNAWK